MFENFFNGNITMKYRTLEKKIFFEISENDIKEVNFQFPIRQVVESNNKYYIRLEPNIGIIFNENVFCYDKNGEMIWKIKPTNTIDTDCPYTNIKVDGENLFLYNWSGEKILVNFDTGEILKKEFTK